MTKAEIETFIERMEEIGDVWEEADVERVYGNQSLEDALNDEPNAGCGKCPERAGEDERKDGRGEGFEESVQGRIIQMGTMIGWRSSSRFFYLLLRQFHGIFSRAIF